MPKIEYSKLQDSDAESSSRYHRTFIARYYGRALVERWHTQPMLPWIIAEIQRLGSPKSETVFLTITECSVKATHVKFGRLVFEHKLGSITKFNQLAESPRCFAYLTKESSDISLCHAFQASDELAVFQLFTVLKEAIQESPLGLKCKEDSPFDAVQNKQCQQYEVLYVGKIKVSQKKGSPRFVDESITKLFSDKENSNRENNEIANVLKEPENLISEWSSPPDSVTHPLKSSENDTPQKSIMRQRLCSEGSQMREAHKKQVTLAPPSSASLITHSQSLDTSSREALIHDIQTLAFTTEQFSSVIEDGSLHRQTSMPPMNAKTFLECSLGFPFSQEDSSHSLSEDQNQDNKTMLFLISPSDIRLISADKKELLFLKDFPNISHCAQGEEYPDYFGLICRETTMTGMDTFIGYIFQCQSSKIVNELMKTLKQSFQCAVVSSQEKRALSKIFHFCDSCPMHWFHRLCSETEGESAEQVQSLIMMHIAALPEKEQKEIMSKYQEIIVRSLSEQNIVFMTLIRAVCEQKQMKHTHSVSKDKKDKRALSPLSSLTSMAKKTFPSTFDSVFREAPLTKAYSLPVGARSDIRFPSDKKAQRSAKESHSFRNLGSIPDIRNEEELKTSEKGTKTVKIENLVDLSDNTSEDRVRKESSSMRTGTEKSLSDTAAVLWDLRLGQQQMPSQSKENVMAASEVKINELQRSSSFKSSPLRNIFMRVGSKKGSLKEIKEQHGAVRKTSLRKLLFNRVQNPLVKDTIFGEVVEDKRMEPPKHSSSHLKALWKKAIMEQIIVIRLEREQKKLKMKQDKILEKHIKLEYDVICPSGSEAHQKWEALMNTPHVDYDSLEEAVKYGVPRQKRGEVWIFLAKKYYAFNNCSPVDGGAYNELLKKLTPYQHAILVDIGRTYPTHPYFKQVLGAGQLSLFSLLKAYSVVDEEVGYCQGLSFLGGILLLHLDEEKSFYAMKHIMFTLGLRNQYKADMAALQVQMYQVARLVQTTVPEIQELFDKYDVSPMLYAAPWFLTLFASHFPIGFVARLLDLLFLQGLSVLFKVTVLLLKTHQSQILKCNSFESVVSYLKSTLPSSGHIGMEKVLDQVLSLDVEKALQTYQIEYNVLKEEISEFAGSSEVQPAQGQVIETTNKDLEKQNNELSDQLQVALNTINKLEASVTSYQSTIRKLESHVRSLQDERDALHHSVNILRKRLEIYEATGKDSESPSKKIESFASFDSKS